MQVEKFLSKDEIILPSDLESSNSETPSKEGSRLVMQLAQFSGILPPPELLKQYDKICPGLADRIMKMAEGEAAHRHSLDKATLDANINFHKNQFVEARIGQFCALLIGLTTILSGAYMATHGAKLAGGVIGSGGVIGLVSVFIFGRKYTAEKQKEENNQ